jgi:hypothetical protein
MQKKRKLLGILVVVATFWVLDFLAHFFGVGETNYYYFSKFANAVLFSCIWFFMFDHKEHLKKILFSLAFGTWISFYYLVSSYSGFVQFLGVTASYSPPPFVILGVFLHPIFWWIYHCLVFYIGLEISSFFNKSRKK